MKKKTDSLPAFTAGDLTVLKEVLHPKNDDLELPYSLAHASLAPGTSSLPHILSGSEVYYILQGTGKLQTGREVHDVGIGDCIFVPPGETQSLQNTGSESLQFLCIVSPPWSEQGEKIL